VLYDNSGLHLKAAKCYTSFSQVLDTEQDNFAHALAHNSIGVSCMLLGKGYGTRALFHHQRHAEQTTDPAGSFVAHSNLGLVHMYMGSGEEATKEHQKALEIAILQGDERMQEVATGNLGRCSFVNRDYASAKAGLLQELNLARGMHDVRAQASVLEKLGEIANAEKDFDSASSYFNQERELAKRKGMQITSSNARVKLGISLGNSGLEERMREVERSMSTTF
jgi:tetratricopeptide (TPR) repeat protein